MVINGRFILKGNAEGPILATRDPISFWGCVDPLTGRISDKRHALFKRSVAGKVLVFPFGKGSSTGSLMILELIRNNIAPAAIINIRTEPLLATGSVVGKYMYDRFFPILTIDEVSFSQLEGGGYARIFEKSDVAEIRVSNPV